MTNKILFAGLLLVAACGSPEGEKASVAADTSSVSPQFFCPAGTVKQCKGTTCICVTAPSDYINGTVSGLVGQGLSLVNDGTVIGVTQNGPVRFAIPEGQLYDVEIARQPTGQACVVNNGNGYAPGGPFTVTCAP